MSLPRDLVLKELGIAPVWQLKRQPASAGPADAGEAGSDHRARILTMDWAQLGEAVASCTACDLYKTRTQGVLGVGDQQADWLIIGEARGADEDAQGEPFVGQAGKLLDAMLAAIGLARGENVYIANVLKSRPPGNRNPAPEEVAACLPYLERQIQLIQPKIILALGRFAVQGLHRPAGPSRQGRASRTPGTGGTTRTTRSGRATGTRREGRCSWRGAIRW